MSFIQYDTIFKGYKKEKIAVIVNFVEVYKLSNFCLYPGTQR